MPTLTRYHIKSGLIYFVVALLLGFLILAKSILNLPELIIAFNPVYLHLLMVGWILQLIMGVVYWMFPKYSKEHPRGSEKLGWAVYILLNMGLILRVVGEPLVSIKPEWNTGWVLAISAVLQLLAGWGFIVNTWGRVKER